MNAFGWKMCKRLLTLLLAAVLGVAQGAAFAQSSPAYTQQELDQMLAPIALYPDPLLSQILMASTYPLELVEAARWSRAYPGLSGDDAVRAVADRDWDPSVKSLVAFPQVLVRMDEQLDWTRNLGDAFLAQQPQVMDTIQNLRHRAQAAGTLQTDGRQRVVASGPTLVIEPAQPQVVYVPYYDPFVVYGPWWWPANPPMYWAPWPGYAVAFRQGLNAGFSWGSPPSRWQHEPAHRRGIAYRDSALGRESVRQSAVRAEARTPQARPEASVNRAERRDQQRGQRREARQPDNPPAPIASRASAPVRAPRAAVVLPAPQGAPQVRSDASVNRSERREERREQRRDTRQPENRPAVIANPAPVRESRAAEVRVHRDVQPRANTATGAQPLRSREHQREANSVGNRGRAAVDARGAQLR